MIHRKPASTIMNYKAAMRTWFTEYHMDDTQSNPFESIWVEKTITGIQKEDAKQQREGIAPNSQKVVHMTPALTLDMLALLRPALISTRSTSFERMRWAALRLGVTGLLRPNEFVGSYRHHQRALRPKQVSFYAGGGIPCSKEDQRPTYLLITMHDTKADPMGRNPPRRIDDEETVNVMWRWQWERSKLPHTEITQSKFFAWNAHTLSGKQLTNALNDAATMHGWYNPRFTMKCFRRGGATTLMAAGASTAEIMQAGAWKSSAMVTLYADRESQLIAANKRSLITREATAAAAQQHSNSKHRIAPQSHH